MEGRRQASPRAPGQGAADAPLDQAPRSAPPDPTAARVDDVAAAEMTRSRLRQGPLEAIPTDPVIRPILAPGELVVSVRHHALVDWHPPAAEARTIEGDVYLTSTRLVAVGADVVAWDLELVSEADVTDRQLLLLLADGTGVALTIDRPASFRVKVQAARLGRVSG